MRPKKRLKPGQRCFRSTRSIVVTVKLAFSEGTMRRWDDRRALGTPTLQFHSMTEQGWDVSGTK